MKMGYCIEDKVVSLESSINRVEQYGRRNNIVISGILDDISDDKSELLLLL